MNILFSYLRPSYGKMSVGISIKVLGTLVELALPYILSHILKNVVVKEDIGLIVLWGVVMILCAGGALWCNIIANRIAARVACDFSLSMRQDLFDKSIRISAAQTDAITLPSLESRITTDTYNVHSFVSMMLRMGIRAPMLLIGGIAITLLMDSYLALAMLSILPFIFVTVYFISKKGVPLYTKVQRSVDKMIRIVREDVQGIRVIKALSKNDYEHRRYDAANKVLVGDEKRAGTVMSIVNPVMTLLMNVGIVAVVALSASRVANHLSDPETVIAFMQYFTLISMAMMSVTRIFVMQTKCAASAKRIGEVLAVGEDMALQSEEAFPNAETDAHIVFDRVSFSYKGAGNDLTDISFAVPRGGSLGIIGATGSGKTTLVDLIPRFYDATDGHVLLDGTDVREYCFDALYDKLAFIGQRATLFSGSIRENVFFGQSAGDDTDADLQAALELAQASEFVSRLDKGTAYPVAQQGRNLSGGQKQRLSIARALARKPEILIFDDAFSALDYKTDAALRAGLAQALPETTKIIVAQRISTIRHADRILVLEHGEIVGDGTHEALLQSCEVYRQIALSQLSAAELQ